VIIASLVFSSYKEHVDPLAGLTTIDAFGRRVPDEEEVKMWVKTSSPKDG
jgi:hypothetical protein